MRDIDFVRASAPAKSGSRAVYFAALGWLVWLLYMVPVIGSLLATHPSPVRLIASLCGAAVFVAIYVWTAWHGARRVVGVAPTSSQTRLQLWLPILAMLALSIVLTESQRGNVGRPLHLYVRSRRGASPCEGGIGAGRERGGAHGALRVADGPPGL